MVESEIVSTVPINDEFKVFYSWQSDLPSCSNKDLIYQALRDACHEISADPEISLAPRVDQDTEGVPGSPPIAATILKKIDACNIFVADVSLCFEDCECRGKKAPNPNVLIELGYALAKLEWKRVILIQNLHFGKIEELPFDLRQNRVETYTCNGSDHEVEKAKSELKSKLKAQVARIASEHGITSETSKVEDAIAAISNDSRNRRAKILEFQDWLIDELKRTDPGRLPTREWVKKLEETVPIAEEFARVADAAACAKDPDSIEKIWSGLQKVLDCYDYRCGHWGLTEPDKFDWWKFHGHEMSLIIVAILIREKNYERLAKLLEMEFPNRSYQNSRGNYPSDFRNLFAFPATLDPIGLARDYACSRNCISVIGLVLMDRFSQGSKVLPSWNDILAADLLLSLLTELDSSDGDNRWQRPDMTYPYLQDLPEFLATVKTRKGSAEFRALFHVKTNQELQVRLTTEWTRVFNFWSQRGLWIFAVPSEVIEFIGTVPENHNA